MPAAKRSKIMLKGSFTVEASIIFSAAFILICTLVYVFIIMYQYSALQSTANKAANTGAYYYANPYGSGYIYPGGHNLYWRLLDENSGDKKSRIRDYTLESPEPQIMPSHKNIEVDTSFTFLLRQLKVDIEEQYRLPAGKLLEAFGISPGLKIKAGAVSPVDDNAEFVRNLDMIADIRNCIANSDNKWIGGGSMVGDVIDKLLKKD